MSCGCSNSTSTACPEVPYPTISPESVPSLIDNLVYALYGTIEKSVSSGRVIVSGLRVLILLFFRLRLLSAFFLFNLDLLSLEVFLESHCWSRESF